MISIYDQFLQSCPFLIPANDGIAHDLCLGIINSGPQRNLQGIQESTLLVWTQFIVQGRHQTDGLLVKSHQPLMRGPAARTKYNLRKSSIFYVEKVSTYPHQNPGLAEQHSRIKECLGNPKVYWFSCPAKQWGHLFPSPRSNIQTAQAFESAKEKESQFLNYLVQIDRGILMYLND